MKNETGRKRERVRELNKRRKFAGGKICKNANGRN